MSDDAPPADGREGGGATERLPAAVHRYLVSRFCVMAALQIQAVAVGWYVYDLTNSALDLGFIGLAQFLPNASLCLVAGQVIDHFPRRRVTLAGQSIECLCSSLLALLAFIGTRRVELVFLLIACYGAARAFETTASATLLPALVSRTAFPRAVALSSLASQSAVIAGPSVGGLLYLLGTPVPFFAVATLLLIAFFAILSLPESAATRSGEPVSWHSVLGGIRFFRDNEAMRGVFTLDVFGVLFGGATALLPIFARDILTIGPAGLGLLRSAPAIGALVIGLVLARRPMERHVGRRMLFAVAVYAVATIVFGLSRWPVLSFAALAIVGAADMVSVVIRKTLIQTATPDRIRGRVNAVNTLFLGTSNQLGEFESGVTATWLGAVGSVVLGGAVTLLVVALWSRHFPALRRMDHYAMAPAEGD